MTITGSNLCIGNAVYFGTAWAGSPVPNADGTVLQVSSPALPDGTVVDVTVVTPRGTSATSPADQFTYDLDLPSAYTPLPPQRVLDSRSLYGGCGRIGPGGICYLGLGGLFIPTTATSAILNVTVTDTTSDGALSVDAGGGYPKTSSINWFRGQTVSNLTVVPLEPVNGGVRFWNYAGWVDLVVDLQGYFAGPAPGSSAGEFMTVIPSRILDTRSTNSALHAGQSRDVQVAGAGGVPATGVAAVVLNATVTNTTANGGFLTAYSTGTAIPMSSNLNWMAGDTRANRVVVPVGAGGKVSFYNGVGSADLVLDVSGYFTDATASGSLYVAPHPELDLSQPRILDTRSSAPLTSLGSPRVVAVAGLGNVPPMSSVPAPKAVAINVTVTDATTGGALAVWPDGAVVGMTSDINWRRGQTVANLVIVQLGSNGKIDLYDLGGGSVDVVVDVEGWFG